MNNMHAYQIACPRASRADRRPAISSPLALDPARLPHPIRRPLHRPLPLTLTLSLGKLGPGIPIQQPRRIQQRLELRLKVILHVLALFPPLRKQVDGVDDFDFEFVCLRGLWLRAWRMGKWGVGNRRGEGRTSEGLLTCVRSIWNKLCLYDTLSFRRAYVDVSCGDTCAASREKEKGISSCLSHAPEYQTHMALPNSR